MSELDLRNLKDLEKLKIEEIIYLFSIMSKKDKAKIKELLNISDNYNPIIELDLP